VGNDDARGTSGVTAAPGCVIGRGADFVGFGAPFRAGFAARGFAFGLAFALTFRTGRFAFAGLRASATRFLVAFTLRFFATAFRFFAMISAP
jgi:hypothetical protein